MTYRTPGGPGHGEDAAGSPTDIGDVELDALRRTSPRRAARIEAARNGRAGDLPYDVDRDGGGLGTPLAHDGSAGHDAAGSVAEDGSAVYDAAGSVAEDGSAGYDAAGSFADDGSVGYDAPGSVAYDEVPSAGQAAPFGDPVGDGYIDPLVHSAPPRRRRRGAGPLALVVVIAIVCAAGWFAYQGLRPVLDDLQGVDLFAAAEDYAGPGQGSVEVVVAPGDTGAQMGRTLADADVVASAEAFVGAANAEPEFTSVQPGRYMIAQQLPAVDAVAALLDPANRVNSTVVIAEGLRLEQILDRLAEDTGLPREELAAAVETADLPAAPVGVDGVRQPAEGFLYPDGYQFGDDPTATEVVEAMIARGQEVMAEVGVAPDDQLEVLTKASLIQGEARADEDFGKVARVIENRIAIDEPLGLDSTVNYATETFDTRTTAEQRDSDSPFNTYRFDGLPPGPIKSPGRQAIEAALTPTAGPWLYFATVDLCTGETAFAETAAEHQVNVERLNAWQRENTNEDGSLNCG